MVFAKTRIIFCFRIEMRTHVSSIDQTVSFRDCALKLLSDAFCFRQLTFVEILDCILPNCIFRISAKCVIILSSTTNISTFCYFLS